MDEALKETCRGAVFRAVPSGLDKSAVLDEPAAIKAAVPEAYAV
jgi:hypothetical protein